MGQSSGDERCGPVVVAGRVRAGAGATRVGAPGQSAPAGPTLEVIREGGVVRAIDITCSCGQRLRVVCDYDPAGGPG